MAKKSEISPKNNKLYNDLITSIKDNPLLFSYETSGDPGIKISLSSEGLFTGNMRNGTIVVNKANHIIGSFLCSAYKIAEENEMLKSKIKQLSKRNRDLKSELNEMGNDAQSKMGEGQTISIDFSDPVAVGDPLQTMDVKIEDLVDGKVKYSTARLKSVSEDGTTHIYKFDDNIEAGSEVTIADAEIGCVDFNLLEGHYKSDIPMLLQLRKNRFSSINRANSLTILSCILVVVCFTVVLFW